MSAGFCGSMHLQVVELHRRSVKNHINPQTWLVACTAAPNHQSLDVYTVNHSKRSGDNTDVGPLDLALETILAGLWNESIALSKSRPPDRRENVICWPPKREHCYCNKIDPGATWPDRWTTRTRSNLKDLSTCGSDTPDTPAASPNFSKTVAPVWEGSARGRMSMEQASHHSLARWTYLLSKIVALLQEIRHSL